jgi:hypothetical protein
MDTKTYKRCQMMEVAVILLAALWVIICGISIVSDCLFIYGSN